MIKFEDLRVGLKVWVKPKKVSAIVTSFAKSVDRTGATLVKVIVPAENKVYEYGSKQLAFSANEMFEIGDTVNSIYGNFHGRVTGFEPETNRVVCVSLKDRSIRWETGDRRRYAYKPHELTVVPTTIEFVPGNKYVIEDGVELLCVAIPESTLLYLVVIATGECLATVREVVEIDAFANTPLESISELSN